MVSNSLPVERSPRLATRWKASWPRLRHLRPAPDGHACREPGLPQRPRRIGGNGRNPARQGFDQYTRQAFIPRRQDKRGGPLHERKRIRLKAKQRDVGPNAEGFNHCAELCSIGSLAQNDQPARLQTANLREGRDEGRKIFLGAHSRPADNTTGGSPGRNHGWSTGRDASRKKEGVINGFGTTETRDANAGCSLPKSSATARETATTPSAQR